MKDVVVTKGLPTTAGSKILEGWRPPYDATITARIKDAGIVMLGKTNMDEFAMGSLDRELRLRPDPQPVGPRPHPRRLVAAARRPRSPAFEAPLAIGTDTGGSIRQPAAVTGIVGHKPTYGAVSRYGLIAFSSSLDQAGPFAPHRARRRAAARGDRRPRPVRLDLDRRARSPPVVAAAREGARGDLAGVRVGVVRELGGEGYQPGVLAAFDDAVDDAARARRRGRRGRLPALRLRAAGLLPDRAERVLVQPGPLRRGALRPAGRRRRRATRSRRSCR